MKIITLALICSGLFYVRSEAQKLPAAALEGLDSTFRHLLTDYKAAGFSVAVVRKDSLIYAKGFGYRDLEHHLPVTENTLFAIGSSTKAFTAAILGRLQAEEKLSLDDKVVKYLPQLTFYDDRGPMVTIRDMMTHRTGLSRYDFSWYMFNSDSRDSLLARVAYMKPNAALREKWQYNNYMYMAQGMIAEKLTGKSWEENIRDYFFVPLDMHRSNLTVNKMKTDSNAALGYRVDEKDSIRRQEYYPIRGMAPAGAINSSAFDMSHWLKVWISGGKYGDREILKPEYIEQAASSQMVIAAALPAKLHPDMQFANYGLGWMLSSYRGHYRVEHGGNIDGFTASVAFFPTDGLGIVVLCNQNNSTVPAYVRNYIADKLLGLPFFNWNDSAEKKKEKDDDTKPVGDELRVPNTRPSHELKAYAGVYENPAYGKIILTLKNDTLQTRLGNDGVWLGHYHYDVFTANERNGNSATSTRFNFRTAVDGSIEGVTIPFGEEEPVLFKRITVAAKIGNDELQKYVGDYEIAGMQIKITVKNGVLYMFVPGQTNYETIAQGNHVFKMKTLQGYSIRFETDAAGKVTFMYAIQPNGTFKASRIK